MDGEPGDVPGGVDPMRIIFWACIVAALLWMAHEAAPLIPLIVGAAGVFIILGLVEEEQNDV